MITNGNTTAEWLQSLIPDLIVVPRLFREPEEGYVQWLLNEVPDPKPVNRRTIPHAILQVEGEARYWGALLPQIMTGTYETKLLRGYEGDAAGRAILGSDLFDELARIAAIDDLPIVLQWAAATKRYRLLFESGRPLYIGMYNNPHRYRDVVPVLNYRKRGRYTVGSRRNHKVFTATNHAEAIATARTWFEEQHEAELTQAVKAVKKQTFPPLAVDLLAMVLKMDVEILDQHGSRVGWKNGGIHGRYGVCGPDWCYIRRCSPRTAAKLLITAVQEARQQKAYAPLQLNLAGRVHEYLGLAVDSDKVIFDGGFSRPYPGKDNVFEAVMSDGGKRPLFFVTCKDMGKPGAFTVSVLVPSQKGRGQLDVISESSTPASWGLTMNDCHVWGVSAGLTHIQRRYRDE